MEPIFKTGDYITNKTSGDLAIVKGVTKKGYYQFKVYYSSMFDMFKDVSDPKYDLQVHYQKFFELCDESDKKKLDDLLACQPK